MATDAYQRQLADPRWQKKRLEIFQRDNFTCRHCGGETKELHLHHKYYDPGKQAWEYPDSCYITLCYACHENEEYGLDYEYRCAVHNLRKLGAGAMEMMDFNVGISLFKDCYELINWTNKWAMVMELRDHGIDATQLMRDKLKELGYDFD